MCGLRKTTILLSYFIFILLQVEVFSYSKPTHVSLKDGYTDIVVTLPEDSPENNRTSIVQSIQDLFKTASEVLHEATKNRTWFSKVFILVPSSWGMPELWLPQDQKDIRVLESNGGFPSFLDPDIAVKNLNNREKPYVLQDDGCGQTGFRINMPVKFLLSRKNTSKGIDFIYYWAQYRYGVFAEGGFQNDSRYPQYYSIPGTTKIEVTACSNVPLSYNTTSITADGPCEPKIDEQTGRPLLTECKQIPIVKDMLTSSIMYQQALPRALYFCEANQSIDKQHNPNTPSKHNVLCSEEATWSVILRSPDFAFEENPVSTNNPENVSFQFVQESIVRVVIAIDVSSQMNKFERYAIVKNAIAKFVIHDLPNGTSFGLVFFAEDIKRARGMVYLTNEDEKQEYFESAPFFEDILPTSREACLACAIDFSLEFLKNASNGLQNGIVILVSTNGSLTKSEDTNENSLKLRKMMDDLQADGIRLFALLFSDGKSDSHEPLETLISASRGLLMHLPEETAVQPLSKLYYSFHRIISGITSSGDEDYTMLFVRKVPSNKTDITLKFHVDDSATENLKLFITGPHFQIARPILSVTDTKLIAPSGEEAIFRTEFFIPAWLFTFPSAEVGTYIFKTKRKEETTGDILIIVSGRSSSKTTENTIILRTWMNQHSAMVPGSLKLFAELRYGKHPIINAKLTAIIRGPNGTDLSSFDLLDNGLGDPDITKNDGIYSRYCDLYKYSTIGYYTVTVDASSDKTQILYISNDDCCGSFVPPLRKKVMGPFNRTTGPLTFRLSRKQANYLAPPNRVLDLRIYKILQNRGTVVLRWTAAGAQFDHGAAFRYRLKLFEDRNDAINRFEENGASLEYNREIVQFTPQKDYGNLIEYTVNWNETLEPGFYYFALKAVGSSGRSGKVSNVVEAYLKNSFHNNSTPEGDPRGQGTSSATDISEEISVIIIGLISRLILNRLFSV